MSKNLQGSLSSVTQIANAITATAFSDFDNVEAVENLFEDYKERRAKFEKSYQKELEETRDEEDARNSVVNWYDEKKEVIDEFVAKT